MIRPGRLARLAVGDFNERARTYSFLVTLLAMVWATHVFIPPSGAQYNTVDIHGHRGLYSSAWLGVQLAVLVNAFFGLIGYYLVKNALDRDRKTGVGLLLAATPLSRFEYVLSKWASNLLVLSSMLAVVAVCTGLLQLVRGEDMALNPVALLTPLILLSLPMFALVAAVAVLFEALPLTRGGLGNVAYFFLWALGGIGGSLQFRDVPVRFDPLGIGIVMPSMIEAASRAFPHDDVGMKNTSIGIHLGAMGRAPLTLFPYHGIDWTLEMVLGRIAWVGVALALVGLAALPAPGLAGEGPGSRGAARARPTRPPSAGATAESPAVGEAGRSAVFDLARLAGLSPRTGFGLFALVRAELAIALHGYPKVWFLGALGLAIASLAAPLSAVRNGVAPFLAIWPMLLWSPLGTRERQWGTADILFSAPRPLSRQLPATWLAGVLVGFAVGGAFGLRLLLAGDLRGAFVWLAGALFVPSLALALGVITGNGRAFEGLYLALWYVAALNHVPGLDYTGATIAGTGYGTAAAYTALAGVMLAIAWMGRGRQLAT